MLPENWFLIDERVKQALMLLAVDSSLKGILITTREPSAVSLAANFYQSMLPDEDCPVVKVPLGVTEDRLLGSINIEPAIATGRRHILPGLLASSDSGALCINHINLLDASMINHIAAALDSGVVRLEREGISEIHPARFTLIGSFDKSEGDINPLLSDRVGLAIESETEPSVEARTAILAQESFGEYATTHFSNKYLCEIDMLRADVERARRHLSKVKISHRNTRRLVEAALSLGIEGNRADIFAIRAARVNAALGGRRSVNEEDLITAIRFVLMPRAKQFPEIGEDRQRQSEQESSDEQSSQRESAGGDGRKTSMEDLLIEAADGRLPDNVLEITHRSLRKSASGKRADSQASFRGRYAGSTLKQPRQPRIAIDATLRAAAPFQISRKEARQQHNLNRRIHITSSDFRYKKFKRRSGALFIFCVDASGSMAANRMAQAKGALTRLLQNAYLHRDRVSLISFRGQDAQLLLSPTRSVELGKRLVDALPAGGATPLAKGLLCAIDVARLARSKERSNTVLVLLTDGRANVGLHTDSITRRDQQIVAICEELKYLGALLQTEGISSVVIDTRSKFLSTGEGMALAEWLGGRYIYLPRADADSIYDAVVSVASGVRIEKGD